MTLVILDVLEDDDEYKPLKPIVDQNNCTCVFCEGINSYVAEIQAHKRYHVK